MQLEFTELILGVFLVASSILLFVRPDAKISQNPVSAAAAGGIAGFMAGIIGTGGALRGLALAAFNLEKGSFVATSAAIDSGVDFSRMIIYLANGHLAPAFYWYIPGLFLAAFGGSYAGKLILNRIEHESFRKIVLLLILIIGVITLARFFQHM